MCRLPGDQFILVYNMSDKPVTDKIQQIVDIFILGLVNGGLS